MPWWNDSVFYQVFVRSFYDSDGDGVGDLNGLIEKLDYLNDGDPDTTSDLGVTGIWLMPIHESPSYHGYDVVDYHQVDGEYGTNEDFLRLMDEAHARGIRVIIDLVLNHTSNQHPWFLEALDPESDRRSWYVWADENPEADGWHKSASGFYYGHFWGGMPDLNYENPEVTQAMYDVVRFWLEDMGVDGFRLDAAKHLIEDGEIVEHAAGTLAWLEGFYAFYKGIDPAALTVGEVWAFTDDVKQYVGDKMDLGFEFYLAQSILESSAGGHKGRVERAEQFVLESYARGQFATFLANHDQNRARSQLINDEQAKVAATLQLTFPGVPFVYYGEEIGMQGTGPHENIRRPMQWEADGGFTTGQPWRPYHDDYSQRHVQGQSAVPGSLLEHYRALIRLRNGHPALRIGDWVPVETEHNAVHAALRVSDDEVVLVLLNLSGRPIAEYGLSVPGGWISAGLQPVLLMGEGELEAPVLGAAGGFDEYRPLEALPPCSSFIIGFVP
jgi:glycosidase